MLLGSKSAPSPRSSSWRSRITSGAPSLVRPPVHRRLVKFVRTAPIPPRLPGSFFLSSGRLSSRDAFRLRDGGGVLAPQDTWRCKGRWLRDTGCSVSAQTLQPAQYRPRGLHAHFLIYHTERRTPSVLVVLRPESGPSQPRACCPGRRSQSGQRAATVRQTAAPFVSDDPGLESRDWPLFVSGMGEWRPRPRPKGGVCAQ